jgi:hypothetical protein
MFTQSPNTDISANVTTSSETSVANTPYIHGLYGIQTGTSSTVNIDKLDSLLENEKQYNKTEPWNKLDKTVKIHKLHCFAEKYGKEHSLPHKEVKRLKQFFIECLDKGKLKKTKDVVYDKTLSELCSIPSLHFNADKHNFTLRNLDAKRVSTLKSLTPKRISVVSLNEEN